MFVLAHMQDNLKVLPADFARPAPSALRDVISDKYFNKVIKDIGLVISLWNFVKVGDAYIYPNDGSAHYKVEFKLLVFRPFEGELIDGKIESCHEQGINITLGECTQHLAVP